MAEKEYRAGMERAFRDYIRPLTNVTDFKHLGRILMTTYDD